MTILATTPRITYVGDGVTTAFPVPFVFFGDDELQVIEKVIATGAEIVKTLTTHYTVSGGGGSTGTVAAVVAPAGTVTWTLARNTKRTQEVDYTPNDPFPAETHERALDRLTAQVQELADAVARSAQLSVTTVLASLLLPDPEAARFLRWNVLANGLENADVAGMGAIGIPVPISQGGTQATTAAGGWANLLQAATTAEIAAGTDAVKALTPQQAARFTRAAKLAMFKIAR